MSAIETARLLLRRWQDDDLKRLVALYADPQVARFLSVDGGPWSRERSIGAFDHFRRQWQERGFGPWAAVDKASGRWLGQVGLNELPRWPGPDKIEVGWDLHPSVVSGAEDASRLDGHPTHSKLAPGHALDLRAKVNRCKQLSRNTVRLRCRRFVAHRGLLSVLPGPTVQPATQDELICDTRSYLRRRRMTLSAICLSR